jgi:vesicle coat complex subunit
LTCFELPSLISVQDADTENMRYLLLASVLLSLIGCSRAKPTMAGAKWAQALRDRDVQVRKKAAFTLGNIGSSDPAVLPALIGALKDDEPGVRRQAILALVKYVPSAKEAVPDLTKLQKSDRDNTVRAYAAKALEKLNK